MNLTALTQRQAAELCGVTPRTLRNWPDAPRNDDGSYSGPELVAWLLHNCGKDDLNNQRARLAKEQADRIAIQNAIARGEVGRLSVWQQELERVFDVLRSRLLKLPTALAPQLTGDTVARKRVLDGAIRDVLTALSTPTTYSKNEPKRNKS